MAGITFDTSVIIARRPAKLPADFYLSTVVIAELMAYADSQSQRKEREKLRKAYLDRERLIIPDEADWQTASLALFWLSQESIMLPKIQTRG